MYLKLVAATTAAMMIGAPVVAENGYDGLPRTFLWNPNFNEVVETADYASEGPYTIGFSNASQGDGPIAPRRPFVSRTGLDLYA